jgi:hypothetical protein
MPDSNADPIVLEVAALPREQVGPFLLLGVDKDAANDEIEAHWAQRLIWARAKQIRVALEDVNWAKELLLDRDKRVLADAQSLNPDTAQGELRQLLARHGPLEPELAGWEPRENPLPDIPDPSPNLIPEIETLRDRLSVPEVPLELPAIDRIIAEYAEAVLDPWADG